LLVDVTESDEKHRNDVEDWASILDLLLTTDDANDDDEIKDIRPTFPDGRNDLSSNFVVCLREDMLLHFLEIVVTGRRERTGRRKTTNDKL
jgi:hypothetical protein